MITQNRGTIAFAVCGSFCTLEAALQSARALTAQGWQLLPVMSFAARQDTRFGTGNYWKEQLEAAAGLLDELDAETRIKQEAEEETGYRLERVEKVFEAWMSPGSVSEKLHFFIAEYDESRRTGNGGGLIEEGEDIEVVEITFTDALAAIRSGEIADGKTIMLLQHLALEGVL